MKCTPPSKVGEGKGGSEPSIHMLTLRSPLGTMPLLCAAALQKKLFPEPAAPITAMRIPEGEGEGGGMVIGPVSGLSAKPEFKYPPSSLPGFGQHSHSHTLVASMAVVSSPWERRMSSEQVSRVVVSEKDMVD